MAIRPFSGQDGMYYLPDVQRNTCHLFFSLPDCIPTKTTVFCSSDYGGKIFPAFRFQNIRCSSLGDEVSIVFCRSEKEAGRME